MKAIHGEAPVIGYSSTLEELMVDYEVYEMFYRANANGSTMSPAQLIRYEEFKRLFG